MGCDRKLKPNESFKILDLYFITILKTQMKSKRMRRWKYIFQNHGCSNSNMGTKLRIHDSFPVDACLCCSWRVL